MATGSPGAEQFRDAIIEFRNLDICVGLTPFFRLREELTNNDDLKDRSGVDTVTQKHLLTHLGRADAVRRRVTYNPEGEELGTQLAKAIDPEAKIESPEKPFAGESVQTQSGGLYQVPWDLSGADPNVPLLSQLDLRNSFARNVLLAIDRTIVLWTRLESRFRTQFVTVHDSMRIYQAYQRIFDLLTDFGGSENRVDVAQGVRATEEPRGPANAPNRQTESAT